MNQKNFEIQVLVNGNKCKQYFHENRIFIEAKDNSEYELEIKNNTWNSVLLLTSVDGLSVITGKSASDCDPGYVISPQSPLRIKGFRYSNDEVAAFKFTNKNDSYANITGGDEARKNCGIIGFRIWDEYLQVNPPMSINDLFNKDICFDYNPTTPPYYEPHDSTATPYIIPQYVTCLNATPSVRCCSNVPKFDMGSTWGKKVESKVVDTDFKKGNLCYFSDIYYASRESLINMGVITTNRNNKVSFPKSFPKNFATPPPNWRG